MSGTSKVNHGPCRSCGGPILYLGALFCSPACHFSFLAGGEAYSPPPRTEAPPDPVPEAPGPVVVFEAEEAPSAAAEEALSEEPEAAPFMSFLEPPPDEPPVRRRLYL